MSRFLLFEFGVNTWHDDMTYKWFCMMESMFSHLKYKVQNIIVDQNPKMHERMMKNLLCFAF